jgi:hypothetical protein
VGLTYLDVTSLAFGESEFTADDFARRTGHSTPAKALSEMKRRGLVERVGRGRYRVLAPNERPDLRSIEWGRVREIVANAPIEKAWTGPTAVETWTEGRYRISPTAFSREFHVAVPRPKIEELKDYLKAHGVATKGRKHIGARVVLVPVERLEKIEVVNGEPVISRAETVKLIREHPGLYEGAMEELRGA